MDMDKDNSMQQVIDEMRRNEVDGFIPINTEKNIYGSFLPLVDKVDSSRNDGLTNLCAGYDEMNSGNVIFNDATVERFNTLKALKYEGMRGTGPIVWGPFNNTPSYIFLTAKGNPYTAQALENQTNSIAGNGMAFTYRYSVCNNGVVREESCDFHAAGQLLLARIRELKRLVKEEKEEARTQVALAVPADDIVGHDEMARGADMASYRIKAPEYVPADPADGLDFDYLSSSQYLLDEAIKDYKEWFTADMEIREFEKNNDIERVCHNLAQDYMFTDVCYPLVGFELGSKEKWASPDWKPKIVKLSFAKVTITREEQPDANGRVNFVYMNERWRYLSQHTLSMADKVTEIPVISWDSFHDDVKRYVAQQRAKRGASDWECWYAVPIKHLSNECYVYPRPSWWSLYDSFTMKYSATMMYDRYVARQNDIAWRRIIYVDKNYLEDLYSKDPKGNEKDRQREIREELEKKVNVFLSHRDNNGKTLMIDSVSSADGKSFVDSIRVVTLPETSSRATDDEIHAVSSVSFFGLGLDPRLVGAVPGQQNSSSGTQARELELLNRKKLSVRRARLKRLLMYVAVNNNWCPSKIGVTIKDMTLSTLDNSKTGLVETSE